MNDLDFNLTLIDSSPGPGIYKGLHEQQSSRGRVQSWFIGTYFKLWPGRGYLHTESRQVTVGHKSFENGEYLGSGRVVDIGRQTTGGLSQLVDRILIDTAYRYPYGKPPTYQKLVD